MTSNGERAFWPKGEFVLPGRRWGHRRVVWVNPIDEWPHFRAVRDLASAAGLLDGRRSWEVVLREDDEGVVCGIAVGDEGGVKVYVLGPDGNELHVMTEAADGRSSRSRRIQTEGER